MAYTSNAPEMAPVAKFLPPEPLAIFCDAANEAHSDGGDHNQCMRAGWAAVSKDWERPEKGKRWVRKDNPTSGDVHVDAPLGGKKPKKPEGQTDVDMVGKSAVIVKADDDQRMVYGWASVISENGEPVVDTQDDVIEPAELEKATTAFMADARLAKAMHEGDGIGEVLHSFPLTADLAKSLGLSSDREGWLVGVKVHDDATWAKVKDGTLRAFSIGGRSLRVPVTA